MKTGILGLISVCLLMSGCARVGSDAWCEKMKGKPKGEWTGDEAGSYAKYCVLGMDSEKWCEKLEKKPKGDWTANEAGDYAKNCIVGRSSDKDD